MLLSSRVTRQLLEAAEAVGLSRADVLGPLGLLHDDVDARKIEWTTAAQLMQRISSLLGDDVARLHALGRAMMHVPSFAPLRQLARSIVSVRTLYDIANNWIAPSNVPHLPLEARWEGERRLVIHGEIPASYAPCEPLFHIFQGTAAHLPTFIDLPPARVVESRVTPRTIDLLLEVPPSRTLGDRVKRTARALVGARGALEILEEQRRELAENVEALQRARDEMRLLLDRLPDLVLIHAAGTIIWANRALVTGLGYARLDEIAGRSLLDICAERSRSYALQRMREPPDSPHMPELFEVVLVSKTGGEVIVEIAPTQAVVFDGVPARLLVGRDVTERVRMQQKLIVADRLASVGLLAAGVAHEVNNPLAYVLNNIEIARKELNALGDGADVARTVLGVALEGVDRIRVIVKDLLMLARGDEGPVDAIDVRAVAASTLTLAARDIERTARLVQDFRPAPLVSASESRIAQVLLNLVGNALEAMRDRPREENELVVRIARAPDGRLLLEVSDTGRGIPPADLPRVFEPFFTTKAAGQGTGLGLAIAQRLVVEIGGEIAVTSKPGEGATFRVLLPAVITASPPRPFPDERRGAR